MIIELRIHKNSKWRQLYLPDPQVRYILSYGPRLGGKSYHTSHSAICRLTSGEYYRAYMMRNVLDTVRDSIFQDCWDRTTELNLENEGVKVTESSLIIRYGLNELKGRGFKKSSGKDTAKQKSLAGRNEALIDELEEIDKEDFDQLDFSLRTTKGRVLIKCAFNPPVKGHWIFDEWFILIPATKENVLEYYGVDISDIPDKELEGFFIMQPKKRDDTAYIFSNFQSNIKNLDPSVIQKVERVKKSDPQYYLHKFVGLVPSGKTGLIFKKFETISVEEYEKLTEIYEKRYGQDYGANDPSCLIEVMVHDKTIYIREKFYAPGLNLDEIWEMSKGLPEKIVADGAAKLTIDSLQAKGNIWIESSVKGPDSIMTGIKKIQNMRIVVCEDSINVRNELSNYSYLTDRYGIPRDKPEDKNNHAIDAVRYAIEDIDIPEVNLGSTFILY